MIRAAHSVRTPYFSNTIDFYGKKGVLIDVSAKTEGWGQLAIVLEVRSFSNFGIARYIDLYLRSLLAFKT